MSGSRVRSSKLPLVGLMSVVAAAAQAQAVGGEAPESGRTFSIVPTFTLSETLTNNSRLSDTKPTTDLITLVTPGVHISRSGGRVKGFLDYSLTGLVYARHSANNELQNSLNTAATAEAIEGWGYLDLQGNISQRAISAFGTQSVDPHLLNDNRTEVSVFTLSPYVRGVLAGVANYEARLSYTVNRNDGTTASDVDVSQASLKLGGVSALRALSWSADASRQVFDFKAGRRNEDDRLRVFLNAAIDPQLRVSLIAGHETNNFVSIDKQGHTTRGFGIDWTPTERTIVSASGERRFFGRSHNITLGHRTPRTAWRYVDSRDVSTGFGAPALGSPGTIFDLLFIQLASREPDPVLRAQLVDKILQDNGIAPTTLLPTGALTSAATLERRQELSFAILGNRSSATFAASQSTARRLDAIASVSDDFSNFNLVRQRGLHLTLAHRLTPQSALSLFASLARSYGTAVSQVPTLRTVGINWSSQLGPRSSLVLGARRAVFTSPTEPYTESALTANLSYRI